METKHTQGEWKYEKGMFHPDYKITCEGVHIGYAKMPKNKVVGEFRSEMEANAKLIASAPDLLEALQSALPYLHKETRIKAEQAIKKATE